MVCAVAESPRPPGLGGSTPQWELRRSPALRWTGRSGGKRLSDADAALRNLAETRDAYGSAVYAFIRDDKPVNQIIGLAQAVSHWASLRIAERGCDAAPPANGAAVDGDIARALTTGR
jgi:hypothetical protein